ncbi:MAG TPA: mucoidy inhibitor MuiA family protein [Chitinophagales bacterium]|nr:mucoidy inhibitor MuiA family protein [Chitinophagales bacterium]HNL85239.1 mucoidy inhibitor MuiA family protein [Chitinophagales bacterium]
MKRFSLLILCFVFFLYLQAENPKIVSHKISDIILYPSGAQINREGNVQLQSGTNEIVFKNLSSSIDINSIQVIGNGNYTILSVKHKYNYLEEKNKADEIAEIQSKMDSVQQVLAKENALLTAYIEQQNMLIKNQYIGGSNTGIKAEDLKEVADLHLAKMTEVKLKQVEINAKIDKLQDLKNRLSLQQKEAKSKLTRATSEIWVSLSSATSQKTSLQLTYFESQASWTLFYDLRVSDVNEPLHIDYKAKIKQNTTEDWKDVQLTLSTSEPKSTAQLPYLGTWYLYFNNYLKDYRNLNDAYKNVDISTLPQYSQVSGKIIDNKTGEALIGVNVTVQGTTVGTVTDIDGFFSLQLPQGEKQVVISYVGYKTITVPVVSEFLNLGLEEDGAALDEVVVSALSIKRKKKYAGSPGASNKIIYETDAVDMEEMLTPIDVNFVIKNPYTINGDNKENIVEIKSETVKPIYKYYAIPKLDKSVFLTANITNWENLNLLAGEANLYFQNNYVGRTLVNPAITEDTLMLSLGRDKNIVINREKVKEFSKKQFLSGDKVINNSFSISIRNNKKQPIDLTIYDQIPVSTTKEIKVDLLEKQEADLDETTGKLTWKIFVEPTKEKKLQFGYAVKYPKNKILYLKE